MMPSPVMEPAVHVKGQEPLTPSMLAAAPLLEQKQLLGMSQLCIYFAHTHFREGGSHMCMPLYLGGKILGSG